MMTMRQGLWTNLMEPRQRHGESRGFEGSTLGSWQILANRFFISIFPWGQAALSRRTFFLQVHSLLFCHFDCLNDYLQMGMLVVEEEWEREVRGGGGIPVLKEV